MHADGGVRCLRRWLWVLERPAGTAIALLVEMARRERWSGIVVSEVPRPVRARIERSAWKVGLTVMDVGRMPTPDDDPRWLYTDALIALDEGAGINNGAPSMWARHLVLLDVARGTRVLQVGAGGGYYTAILAHLVGAEGRVAAHETEPHLAARAALALGDVSNVAVMHGNGATDPDPGPHDLVIAFAGVTHPVSAWIDALGTRGRMLLPVTGTRGWGAFVLFEREGPDRMALTTVGRCGFYPCAGARDDALAERWDALLPGAENGARMAMERRAAASGETALPGGWALSSA